METFYELDFLENNKIDFKKIETEGEDENE